MTFASLTKGRAVTRRDDLKQIVIGQARDIDDSVKASMLLQP